MSAISDVQTPDAEAPLSEQDLKFFDDNGYILAPGVVPRRNAEAVVEAIHTFLGIGREPSPAWYAPPVDAAAGMVEMYQHPAMWDNRQHPKVHGVFTQLLGRSDLWVSIDRVCFKPPPHPDHPEFDKSGFLHVDADTSKLPIPFGLQAVLYLSDTAEDQGGFHCLPGWHKRQEAWRDLAGNAGLRGEAVHRVPVKPIAGKAGDLLIWNRALPHGNGRNRSNRPRLAQYILMSPAGEVGSDRAAERIRAWREHSGPVRVGPPFHGDPRGWEREHGRTAELTPLGRKLLGLDPWR